MLEITNLCRKYDQFSLGPIDLHLEPGTVHGLIGPNGAGKTTLYRCVMGTVRRDQGLIKVKGRVASADSGSWKQLVGYAGDYTPLFEHWTGGRNLKAFSAYYPTWSEETVQSLASRFDLNLSQVVSTYSTVQRLVTISWILCRQFLQPVSQRSIRLPTGLIPHHGSMNAD